MGTYEILDSLWYTNATLLYHTSNDMASIGVVAVRTNTHESETERLEWKAYIGVGGGVNRKADEQSIAMLGSGLQPEEAHGFFPRLEISQYKKV